MLPQAVLRSQKGIYSQYNPTGNVPDGALLQAENVVIDREGIITNRRGFDRYATVVGDVLSMMEFGGRLLVLDGTTWKYDDGAGSLTSWTGTFSAPTGYRVHWSKDRRNLYFCDNTGIKRTDTLATSPVDAGMPQALDVVVTDTGTGLGWHEHNSRVAYRIIWVREDANGRLLLGPPSTREVVTNAGTSVTISWAANVATVTHTAHGYTTGDTITIADSSDTYDGARVITVNNANEYEFALTLTPGDATDAPATAGKIFNHDLVFTIPENIVIGDFYEIYRTEMSASSSADPGEEFQRVKKVKIEATATAGATLTFSDTYNEAWLDDLLYTNPSQQTISQANDRPPWAADITLFKGYAFYGQIRREHQIEVKCIDLDAAAVDDTFTVTQGVNTRTYTAKATEVIGSQQFLLSTAESTEAQNVAATVKSLIRCINRDTSNTWWWAFYTSGDDAPGRIAIKGRDFTDSAISLTANATDYGDTWEPELPTSGTDVSSEDPSKQNVIHRSKFEQPDAVPLLVGSFSIGSEEYPIERILALRDSLVILKKDGVWRLTGESERSFTIRQLDPSTLIRCPESAVVLNNAVYVVSNQGVVRISGSGTAIVSRPIEVDFKKLFSFSAYETTTHAIAYESEHKYIVFTKEASGDDNPEIAWVYDYITEAWTTWRKEVTAAHVLFDDDVLYMINETDRRMLQERKSYGTDNSDYQDEDIAITITANDTTTDSDGNTFSTATFAYSYTGKTLVKGFYLTQSTYGASITAVTDHGDGTYTVTLSDYLPSLANSTAAVSMPITATLLWAPIHAGSTALMKQFVRASIYQQGDFALHHKMRFRTDIDNSEATLEFEHEGTTGWGVPAWGDFSWGSEIPDQSTPVSSIIPRGHQRCRALYVGYTHSWARERIDILNIAVTYRPYGDKGVSAP